MRLIAGHHFVDGPNGLRCDCGAKWVDVLQARPENVRELGWAHTGALLESELAEIEAERERIAGCL